jgi:benzodiazapine receptor
MKKKKISKKSSSERNIPWPILLATSFLICFGIAGLGSAVTMPGVTGWYREIAKPSFNPPNSIFAPVWTVLFFLMAISAFLISIKGLRKSVVRRALAVFGIQLGLNFFWSLTFFGFHNPGNALLVIIVLWLTIAWTMVRFWIVNKTAAVLLIPYLLWVSFAAYLNYSIYLLWR